MTIPAHTLILLGFDAREEMGLSKASWTAERKAVFLLRDDIDCPLSVDQQTWPSVLVDPDSNEWRGVLGHWTDYKKMSTRALEERVLERSSVSVAVAIVWDLLAEVERREWREKYIAPTIPDTIDSSWRIVGYDVADRWLVSGLSNCGYSSDEYEVWRRRWGAVVNAVHLFDDPSEAQSFATETNERVPEHAPFFVYALLVRALDSSE